MFIILRLGFFSKKEKSTNWEIHMDMDYSKLSATTLVELMGAYPKHERLEFISGIYDRELLGREAELAAALWAETSVSSQLAAIRPSYAQWHEVVDEIDWMIVKPRFNSSDHAARCAYMLALLPRTPRHQLLQLAAIDYIRQGL
jgi:hypothetical protein